MNPLTGPTDPGVDLNTRPVKKARYEEFSRSPTPVADDGYDDAEFLYGQRDTPNAPAAPQSPHRDGSNQNVSSTKGAIPGLDLVTAGWHPPQTAADPDAETLKQQTEVIVHESTNGSSSPSLQGMDHKSWDIEYSPSPQSHSKYHQPAASDADLQSQNIHETTPTAYKEFLEAATANRIDENAEWQLDSSDAQSSSSSDSDTSSDDESASSQANGKIKHKTSPQATGGNEEDEEDEDDDEEVDYELLSPEEQARILMKEEGGDDGEERSKDQNSRLAPRTTNEQAEDTQPKPDIVITPEMNTPELGVAEGIIENYLLVRATLSGETRVLESGSVLCLQDKTIIGVVAEPLGRVEAPLYSVAFSNKDEVKKYGIEPGIKIHYVEAHSTYVFTQPLKLQKGSDASNLHDEEIADDDREFSDDEAEAEYKRKRKLDKLSKKGIQPARPSLPAKGLVSNQAHSHPQNPTNYPSNPINYDEDEENDGMYQPLTRPSNLLDQDQPPRIPPSRAHSRGPRSHGHGPRNHRGRHGASHFTPKDRGDRNGQNQQRGPRGQRGNHYNQPSRGRQNDQPPQSHIRKPDSYNRNSVGQAASNQHTQYASDLSSSYMAQGPVFNNYWPPNQSTPHNGGQHSQPSPSNDFRYRSPISPAGAIPAGAFVNPAFFANNQWGPTLNPPSQQSSPTQYAPWPQTEGNGQQGRQNSAIEEYDPTRPWIQ